MASIAFSCHFERHHAVELAWDTARWLAGEGHEAVVLPDRGPAGGPLPADGDDLPPRTWDLVVSLGGDGTMLRTVSTVLGLGVPVLGVNFGRFGYLTAVEPDNIRPAVQRFLAGEYSLDRRLTLDSDVAAGPGLSEGPPVQLPSALNDIVLARPSGTHTINVELLLSGQRFLSYAADAMIIATPTGSTGYNLSARGPIVAPGLRCLVVTPVAPHMLFDRSVLLEDGTEVVIELGGRCPAEIIVDGNNCGQLEIGERLVCRAGAQDALLVNFGDRKFESVLKNKFHLSDR